MKILRLIGKLILGSGGTLLLIIWALVSWIQRETKMSFYQWAFVIVITLSILYGLTELIRLMYRLWRNSQETAERFKMLQKSLNSDSQLRILSINSAQYGAHGVTKDVTEILRSKVVSSTIRNFRVVNENLDALGSNDPAKGMGKMLEVKYSYCGEFKSVRVKERDTLSLPE